jgi:type 1 glutamine amidotransferase
MDILLKPEAKAAANRYMNSALDSLPETFASTQPPSFSAILTLTQIAGMAQIPAADLAPLDKELRALAITDEDREARCARYDTVPPQLVIPEGKPRLLLFQKINGFRDVPSVEAATAALQKMAKDKGWAMVETDNGAVMAPALLSQFDAVIWNNISGDVLTLTQRRAFTDYIDNGGGFVGLHGSGGDFIYFWDWYVDELIGARFIGHPMDPQFQDAKVVIESTDNAIGNDMAPGFTMNEEWYSFKTSPRDSGATVIATLDETSYSPIGRGGQDVHMGEDHPIVWTRCIGDGRSFYSAIGHRPELYTEPHNVKIMERGILWAAGLGSTRCQGGSEVARNK